VGDPLYDVGGLLRVNTTALPGDGGYFLHAARVRFVHPESGADLEIHARPPATFCQALQRYW
jgi:23S rRNA pseudouridine1911/1915/1917 synthase